jgi:UDP-N-acetylmuramoylalanine--D-glutamate ligase
MNTEQVDNPHLTGAVFILGKGVSGQGAAALADALAQPWRMLDDKSAAVTPGIFDDASLIVVSPGMPPSSPLYQAALESGIEVVSELEFAARHFSGKYLALTGTNGKTTTVELTVHLLKALEINACEAGNIGVPFAEIAAKVIRGEVSGGVLPVVEVSSFQLERVKHFAPFAAAIMNIQSDHLDRYPGGMKEYSAVKFKIFDNVALENRITSGSMVEHNPTLVNFRVSGDVITYDNKPLFKYSETSLNGAHNLENLLVALELVSRIVGPDKMFSDALKSGACSFTTGEHRQEKVLERDGVVFINDSKATNPASVVAALKLVMESCNGVRLILGGKDKDMDFSPLLEFRDFIRHAYVIGECREKILTLLDGIIPCSSYDTFEGCVKSAAADANCGEAVLLAPGCASWDMFSSYKERGRIFKELILGTS